MWQRFTEAARKAVFYAQEEAKSLGSQWVATEHLLLGLVREKTNVACVLIQDCGFDPQAVESTIRGSCTHHGGTARSDMTLSPRAKGSIDLAYGEARKLNNNYIGTEHLLMGLILEDEGLAGRLLGQMGFTIEAVRKATLIRQDQPTKPGNEMNKRPGQGETPTHHAWSTLARKGNVPVDMLCVLILQEEDGPAAKAVQALGCDPSFAASVIEEELVSSATSTEAHARVLSTSDFLSLAGSEADQLSQSLTSVHFLLAALADGRLATARALLDCGISYDDLVRFVRAPKKCD